MSAKKSPLPVDELLDEIVNSLRSTHRNLVVIAEPGAGKTTRIPPALLKSDLVPFEKEILVLQPRRIAARATAERIADENSWGLGTLVGYQVRFENRTSASTRLKILTEGVLTQIIRGEPTLPKVGMVILVEFHERNLHSDFAIAWLRQLQATSRPDLKIVVMSATLDAESVSTFLGSCPVIRSKGRNFPIQISFGSSSLAQSLTEALADPADDGGDVLVFLPGVGEIEKAFVEINALALRHGVDVDKLHGSIGFSDQKRIIGRGSRRRIILATNIAETSLTIDGVTTVIDTGLEKALYFDAKFGTEKLRLQKISKKSADQRSGRAGRTAPGRCFRLWTRNEHLQMQESNEAQIRRSDLSEFLMLLLSLGVDDFDRFAWFEVPHSEYIRYAVDLLSNLGVIELKKTGEKRHVTLTSEGREILNWPLHPRLAALMIESLRLKIPEIGVWTTALVSLGEIRSAKFNTGSDRLKQASRSDLELRYRQWIELAESHHSKRQLRQHVEQLRRLSRCSQSTPEAEVFDSGFEDAHKLLCVAYPDRVCRRRISGKSEALMVGRRGILLDASSSVTHSEFFLALNPFDLVKGGNLVSVVDFAVPIERGWLEKLWPSRIGLVVETLLDLKLSKALTLSQLCYQDLPLQQGDSRKANSVELALKLVAVSNEDFESWLQSRLDFSFIHRWRFLNAHCPELFTILPSAELLRSLVVEAVEYLGLDLPDIKLKELVSARLSSNESASIDREAPSTLTMPTGSQLPLDYPQDYSAPLLAVRLQEVFGMFETPKIAGGRVGVRMQLLSPGYKPVQLTQDLRSFWKGAYFEVRKELKARYPKHAWPEDPLAAAPVAKGRPQKR